MFPNVGVFLDNMAIRIDRAHRNLLRFKNLANALLERSLFARVIGVNRNDQKSFYVETPEDIPERIRMALKYVPAEKLWINPNCGFHPTPRWVALPKLKAMVEGTKIVRRELGQGR